MVTIGSSLRHRVRSFFSMEPICKVRASYHRREVTTVNECHAAKRPAQTVAAKNATTDFAAFSAHVWPQLFRGAVLLGLRRPEAEDAAQEALERCLTHWARVQQAENPEAYAVAVLRNAIASRRRLRSAREVVSDLAHLSSTGQRLVVWGATGDPGAPADQADVDVRNAIGALALPHREVVVLRFYFDLSESETARVLRLPRGTVKSRTSRALAKLATTLEQAVDADGPLARRHHSD